MSVAGTAREQVHLYALCWNEAKMIPYFFRHYGGLVDRYFVFDNGSTDGSLELLAGDERVTVVHFDVPGDSFEQGAIELTNGFWKQSRGVARWVATAEMDEHLWHPDLRSYLESCSRSGVSAIQAIGYDMIADAFPTADKPLWQLVTRGVRAFALDKFVLFDPDAIEETNYEVGRHGAAPTGRVVWEPEKRVRLLHYKYLGPDYVAARNAVLSKGIRPGDVARGWGAHYFLNYDEVAAQLREIDAKAAPVPGLGGDAGGADETIVFDEREVLDRSGLFLRDWYLTEYPDVTKAGADPLEHYCRDGWREKRKPNPYFDPAWYLKSYPEVAARNVDPLLDYIVAGEKAGRKPSRNFDPAAYRERHGLAPDESPLRHHLARVVRKTGPSLMSRLLRRIGIGIERELPRYFDPRLYLEANPDVAASGVDPAWHYVTFGRAEGRPLQPVGRVAERAAARRSA